MSDFKNKNTYLFSYSGCNGFNIFLNEEDDIIFGDPCNESQQINTNIPFPIGEKVIIWAYYFDSNLKVAVFNEKSIKPITKSFNRSLEIETASNIGIGKKSEVPEGFFYGYIDFVLIFPDEIPFSMMSFIINEINNKNKLPIHDNGRSTLDDRDCITTCQEDPIPGERGCPYPPKEADPCN